MANRIQLRRDTAANWTRENPILSQGEPGFDLTANKLKVGDGVTAWADLDGTTTFPNGVYVDQLNGSHFPRIVADAGKAFSVQGQGSTGSVALQWMETASASSQIAQVGLNKFSGIAAVTLTAGSSTPTLKVWRFDETGTLTLPAGSAITETTTTTIITPPGASVGQSFVIRPTGSINTESSHIHLVSGNPTTVDLYLGDDDQYVKIEKNAGNVVIGTSANTSTYNWAFGTDGGLTFPVLTIATLPSATPAGQRAFISDGESSLAWGATVSSTGTNTYPVWSDGSNWKIG